ncbi:MAG: hypothetical protein KAI86_04200, partial [Desulfobacterales bacterium]|nr:hypothetical protein [Desulfobacterales bacterium]
MPLGADLQRLDRGESLLRDQKGRWQEALVDGDVRTFGVLDPPFVRNRVARVGKLEAFPLQDETNRTVQAMDRRDAP